MDTVGAVSGGYIFAAVFFGLWLLQFAAWLLQWRTSKQWEELYYNLRLHERRMRGYEG